jgi:hypothetical protein
MLFRQATGGHSTPMLEERRPIRATQETIVRRAGTGRIYTIEVSTDLDRADEIFGARVVQMAAMNRTLGVCRGASRDDVLRKASALIDAALPSGVPKAA